MMKKAVSKICLVICLLGIVSLHAAGEKPVVAVFDFKNVMSWKLRGGNIINLFLMTKLSECDFIELVEREQIDKILKERKLSQSGLVRGDYLKIAALVNADYIVTGRIYKDEDEGELIVNLKLTKCSDGKITGKSFTVPANGKEEEYLEEIAKKAASFIAKSFDNKPPLKASP